MRRNQPSRKPTATLTVLKQSETNGSLPLTGKSRLFPSDGQSPGQRATDDHVGTSLSFIPRTSLQHCRLG